MSTFGDPDLSGDVLLKSYEDYYNGYPDSKGKTVPGYLQRISELITEFPLGLC